jgi:hypothetical protein
MLYCHRRQWHKIQEKGLGFKLEIEKLKAGTAKWSSKGKKKRRARD